MIEHVVFEDRVLAIIVRAEFSSSGIEFFTPDDFAQQLAFMKHPAGKLIEPHLHNPVERTIVRTQEVLFIRKGRLRVDFFGDDEVFVDSRVLGPGDVILLASGGHGFEVLEDLEMFEVKQGPYVGDVEKRRFIASGTPRSHES